jgi:hypothetical protein
MVHKFEVAGHISFIAYARTQFSLPIKNMQADKGTEFVNKTHTSLTAQGTPPPLLPVYFSSKWES